MKTIFFIRTAYAAALMIFIASCSKKTDPPVIPVDPCSNAKPDPSIVVDFDCQNNWIKPNPTDPKAMPFVDNPKKDRVNGSDKVGKFTEDGTSAWDNLFIDHEAAIDLTKPVLHIKIYTDVALATPIKLKAKLEGGTTPQEVDVNIDTKGAWKDYTFDFSASKDKGNTKLILFFNAGETNGTTTDAYYVDDIKFEAGPLAPAPVPPGPEPTPTEPASTPTAPAISANPTYITNFETGGIALPANATGSVETVDNPNKTAPKTSDKVGKYTDNGTDAWDNMSIDFGAAINLTKPILHIKVSAKNTKRLTLKAKLEGGTEPKEVDATIEVVNGWKDYAFDFTASQGKGNTKLVLFFNAGKADGTIADVYYIDDLLWDSNPF